MGIGRFVYTPILPEMLTGNALSLPTAGWVAAANFAGYLIGALVAARVQDRGLQRWLARAGIGGSVLLLAAMAVLQSPWAWMLIRALAGAASAFSLVFVSAIVIERLSMAGQMDRTIWLYAGVGVGIASSALMVLVLVSQAANWPLLWWGAAALALPFAALAWRVFGAQPPRHEAAPAHDAASSRPTAAPSTASPAPKAYQAIVLAYGLFGLG